VAKPLPELSLADWAVLAIVTEGPTHGWPIVLELRADGALGRVWTVARAVVYRSLTTLTSQGLLEECGEAPGVRGPQRTIVRATRAGRRAAAVARHARRARGDVRTELLLKLALLACAGRPSKLWSSASWPSWRR
jgi:DNA-binding PadR family transcriptional regulator